MDVRDKATTMRETADEIELEMNLAFKFDASQVLTCRPSIVRLREMRIEIRLDISYHNQLSKASIVHGVSSHTRITTDGSHLYLHSSKGYLKLVLVLIIHHQDLSLVKFVVMVAQKKPQQK